MAASTRACSAPLWKMVRFRGRRSGSDYRLRPASEAVSGVGSVDLHPAAERRAIEDGKLPSGFFRVRVNGSQEARQPCRKTDRHSNAGKDSLCSR